MVGKMQLSGDTTLNELNRQGLLSTRAKNICNSLGLVTVEQLANIPESTLANVRQSGRKTISELIQIQERYREQKFTEADISALKCLIDVMLIKILEETPALEPVVEGLEGGEGITAMIGATTNHIKRIVDRLDITLQSNAYKMLLGIFNNLQTNLFLPESVYVKIKCMVTPLHALYRASLKRDSSKFKVNFHKRTAVDFGDRLKLVSCSQIDELPQMVKDALSRDYDMRFGQLSTRVRNRFAIYSRFEEAVKLIYSNYDVGTVGGLSEASVESFRKMLDEFYKHLEEELANFDVGNANSRTAIDESLRAELEKTYPYVKDDEEFMAWLMELARDSRPMPAFTLLKKYIESRPTLQTKVHADNFGIGTNFKSLAEIAEEHNFTVERIRQIRVSALRVPTELKTQIERTVTVLKNRIIASTDEFVSDIVRANYNTIDVYDVLALLGSVLDDFKLRSLKNSKDKYLLHCDIFRVFNIGLLAYNLQVRGQMRRAHEERIDLEEALLQNVRNGAEAIDFTDDEKTLLYRYLYSTTLNFEGVSLEDGKVVVFAANSVDRMEMLADVLRQEGKPMKLRDIYTRYNEKYPDYRMNNLTSARSYLLRNPLVNSLGRSGAYALKEWDWVYTGTYTDCLIDLLEAAGKPMHISDLVEEVNKKMNPTTKYRLQALCVIDKKKRFKVEGNFISLNK